MRNTRSPAEVTVTRYSPLMLCMLLHYYYSPLGKEFESIEFPAQQAALRYFYSNDLLEEHALGVVITEQGRETVDKLLVIANLLTE